LSVYLSFTTPDAAAVVASVTPRTKEETEVLSIAVTLT